MSRVFHRLSNVMVLFLVIGSVIMGMEIIPRIIQNIPFFSPTEESSRVGQAMFGPLFSCTAFIVGFLLSQSYSSFRNSELVVANEAGQINSLDRLLLRFGSENALAIRSNLRDYIHSIVTNEWKTLQNGESCKDTHMIWRGISQSIFKLEPEGKKQFILFDHIISKSEEVAESRERRIDISNDRFPKVYWIVIFLCMLTLIGVSTLHLPLARTVLGSAVVPIALGGCIALLIITDRPFRGETAVTHEALDKVLESLKTRKT